MKVYTIQINRNYTFIFYKIDNVLTCVNDINYLTPITASLWTKKDGFIKSGPPYFDRIAVPTFRVMPNEKEYFIKENVLACIQASNTLHKKDENKKEYNCFITYKNLEDGTIELGICTYDAIGRVLDVELTKYIERQFKMKAFW